MISSRLVLFGGLLAGLIGRANGPAAAGRAPCIYPDPYTFVGREVSGLEKVEYRLFDSNAGPMRWLFLSWEGPREDGMAMVLACDGHVIAKQKIGYVQNHDWGDPLDSGPGTAVDVTTRSAAPIGVLAQTESWLRFDGRKIAVLLSHVSVVHPIFLKPGATTDTYEWIYYPPQRQIRVEGKRRRVLIDGPNPDAEDPNPVALPEEKYCFRSDVDRFVRC